MLVGTEAVLHRVRVPVGLVAYLELDQELLAPRARAAEQALWLLVRGARVLGDGGRLLVQTRLPDHEVVRAVRHGDPMVVADADRRRRAALGFPPFGGLAELSGDADAVGAASDAAAAAGMTVLGPTVDGTRALLRAGVDRGPLRRAGSARHRRRPRTGSTPHRRRSAPRLSRDRAGSVESCTRCGSSAIPC